MKNKEIKTSHHQGIDKKTDLNKPGRDTPTQPISRDPSKKPMDDKRR